jgi:hypothetical protein
MSRHKPRNLLHRDKLTEFKAWVLDGRGYLEMPPTGHAYEVFRIRKYDPSGDGPDIFFYQKLPPTQHVTLDDDGERLVKKWLRSRRTKKCGT